MRREKSDRKREYERQREISGSLVVASAEVSECMCGSVCTCSHACGFLCRFVWTLRVRVGVCAGTCVQICFPALSLSLSLSIVGEENPQSLGGWGKSDVSRE